MWPFNKNTARKSQPLTNFVNTLICVPGTWKNREELQLLMSESSGGEYIVAGDMLMHIKSLRHYIISLEERNDQLKHQFAHSGKTTGASDTFAEEIDTHTAVAYISGPTGNLEEASYIAFAASALLKAGGLAVKVETAGKAFEKDNWLSLTDNFTTTNLYNLFVVDSLVGEQGTVYSVGMQNLGLKDTIIAGEDVQQATSVISQFAHKQITDHTPIKHKQTFSGQPNNYQFNITAEKRHPARGQQLLENPLGAWRLSKAQ